MLATGFPLRADLVAILTASLSTSWFISVVLDHADQVYLPALARWSSGEDLAFFSAFIRSTRETAGV